jgi:murein DD-endopeptidase MepM/ murein hydrolase activator NlpD
MSKHRFRIGLLFLFLLFTLISTHIAFADGPIRYLPFKGSVYLTCGYHVNCGNPFIAGEGTDWAISGWSQGVVTYATGQGTVSSTNPVGSFGNQVLIDHISDYWSRHAHLWYWFPAEGHVLAPGMPVGYMGKTGCGSCNPHLHWHAYNQSSAPGELSYGVDPAPIPLPLTPLPPPAPTAIPTDGFTLS